LRRTFIGTAIRAVAQDRGAMALMGADPQRIYLVTSGVGGAMAGLAAALLSIQYSVHPYFGAAFGPITFMVCVLGGLGNMLGAFLGVGAYTTTLLWNFYGLTPWIGTLVAMAAAIALALIVAYPCSRFGIIGHYFALVTLAVGEVVRLLIIAERDWTGGSLGLT